MEKSEPSLVPQWLRSAGSASGGGSSAHYPGISSSHSDASTLGHYNRNRTFRSNDNYDSPRSAFLDRSYSTNSRRNSNSNGVTKNPYSNFSSHRDRDRLKERVMTGFADRCDFDSDPLGNNFFARLEKDKLRRSSSMVLKKQGEVPVLKRAGELKSSDNNAKYNGNGLLSGTVIGNRNQRAVFDKDFPVLGSEEKQAEPDIGRVSSPVLATPFQSLPVGNSALIGGEGWSSALAEVPKVIGTGSVSSSSVQINTTAGSRSGPPSATTGLNMAEALQSPARAGTPPEVVSSVTTHKLEELAIKQSRQLIPVTPSMPKTLALSSSDKLKSKLAARTSELNVVGKNNQQQAASLHSSNQSIGSGNLISDGPKKFLVLKQARENGVSSSPKDVSSTPNSTGNRAVNCQSTVSPVTACASSRSQRGPKPSVVGNKVAVLVERKPSSSQVQSRSDFFNLVRKKSLTTTAPACHDSLPVNAHPVTETSGEAIKEAVRASESDQSTTTNCDTSEASQRPPQIEEKDVNLNLEPYPDKEEAAFLRSLGWDENAGDDECITEEEINAFFEQYMKLKPSLKLCHDMQMRLKMLSESRGFSGTSSKFSSSDTSSKA